MNPHNFPETNTVVSEPPTTPQSPSSTEISGLAQTANTPEATVVRETHPELTSANTPSPLQPQHFGKYELLGEIARGGMGVVYRARQHGLDRLVALKMILGANPNDDSTQRFLQEARAAAAIDHPNVVPIYDIGEIGDKPYFTMALVEGPNLRTFVEAQGIPSIATTLSLFSQIVSGVAYAHKLGIIHRDLKPANVLIDRDGRPRVTDFGLAKRTTVDTQLTATGQVVGTPQYMAPEQARDSKDVGPAADVYALGAILYFMLTGQPPFHGESFTDLLIKVVHEPPIPPRLSHPEIPEDLEALCLKCLAKSPHERFADANELAAALVPIAERFIGPSAILTPSRGSLPKVHATPSHNGIPSLSETTAVPSAALASPSIIAPTAPDERRPRTPWLVGLVTVAVLLMGVVVWLATHTPTTDHSPDAQADPSPSQPNTPPPNTTPSALQLNWPPISRNDFALDVQMMPTPQNGVLPVHQEIYIQLKADRDCFVTVWVLDHEGATLLFPNEDERDCTLKAHEVRIVPGKNTGTILTTPTVGDHDRLRVIAKTGSRPVLPRGQLEGKFIRYLSPAEQDAAVSTMRGLVYKKANPTAEEGLVSEREYVFRVVPK
ncbi:MAG: protein kinase [Gemmataceae bacterium]|nr:serine/threonine-protein kinase [Gemmata sp.]MDW8197875.1 protein kinase [Gemmataceae bacterium]